MDPKTLSLAQLRAVLGRAWLIWLFGIAYVISQLTILVIVEPLGRSFLELQCFGFSAEKTVETFQAWEAAGAMQAYRNHLIFDDIHWIWYSGLGTFLLCFLFERRRIPHRFDWVLVLPLASGLLDWYENHLQHLFLSSTDYSAIVDPLPLFSTLASIAKWSLALAYVVLAAALAIRGPVRQEDLDAT